MLERHVTLELESLDRLDLDVDPPEFHPRGAITLWAETVSNEPTPLIKQIFLTAVKIVAVPNSLRSGGS